MPNKFSNITRKIQNRLPYWFKEMRTNESSIGAQFLNVFGLAIEDVEYMVDYVYNQHTLMYIDDEQVDLIYKLFMPASINNTYDIYINSDSHILYEVDRIDLFLESLDNIGENSQIDFPNPYFVDYEKHVIYVRRPYDADENFKFGKVRIKISKDRVTVFDDTVKLELHHLWNFFDEIGLLLCTPRLKNENNLKYKQRLLDVFKHPANATMTGLINGIGRSLGLRKNVTWENGEIDYQIPENGVIINSIEIDGKKPDKSLIRKDPQSGKIILIGDEYYSNIGRSITYIYGFNMHQLNNKNDVVIQSQIDEPGKPLLEFIKEELKTKAPIFWGTFVWDQSLWDIVNDHTDYIPPRLDGKI